MISVLTFGAVGNGSPASGGANTAAFNAAWAVAHASGGDEIHVPKGHYFLDRQSPADSYGIRAVGLQNIRFVGDAPYLTRLSLCDGADAHLICLEDVADIAIEGMTLDGNGMAQSAAVHALRVLGADGLTVRDVAVHSAALYGIGLQSGAMKRIRLYDLQINDSGGDGIDFKNKLSANEDIEIRGVTVRRHGQKANASPQAGIDIRGPARLTSIEVLEIGHGPAGLCGIRFRDGETADVHGIGGHRSQLSVFRAKAVTTAVATIGVESAARHVAMTAGYVEGACLGAVVHQHENALAAIQAVSCKTGFLLNKPGTLTSNADRTAMSACVARGGTIGFDIETDGNSMDGMVSRSNATAVRVSGHNNRWSGTRGSDPVINTGTGNVIS